MVSWKLFVDIEDRYQVKFLEIGTDKDHVHFLVQSVLTYSVTKLVTMIKSLTAREIFHRCPHVKKHLWWGEFWTDGYFVSTVGKHGDETMIGNYVKNQGKEYTKLHSDHQLALFWVLALMNTPSACGGDVYFSPNYYLTNVCLLKGFPASILAVQIGFGTIN